MQSEADKRVVARIGGARAMADFRIEALSKTRVNEKALQAASLFDPAHDNMYLYGPTGAGKTHMAVAAARRTSERHTLLMKPQQVSRFLRESEDARQEGQRIEELVSAHCLILDDLGTEKLTEYLTSLLYEIVDARYMAGAGGLIVTSNLSLGDLARKLGDDRIPSRLVQMCAGKVFDFSGERDHRVNR